MLRFTSELKLSNNAAFLVAVTALLMHTAERAGCHGIANGYLAIPNNLQTCAIRAHNQQTFAHVHAASSLHAFVHKSCTTAIWSVSCLLDDDGYVCHCRHREGGYYAQPDATAAAWIFGVYHLLGVVVLPR